MSGPNLAHVMMDFLISKKVSHIFGIISHSSFPLTDAMAKRAQLKFINTQHEGGAGNMALGYARGTKKPGVCLVSAGGGATNIATATAQAYKESVPLFVISSEIDTTSSIKGARSSWHWIDQMGLFRPITKQCVKIERAQDIGSVVDSLFNCMMRGRPGPVYLGIPTDVQAAPLDQAPVFDETAPVSAPDIDSKTAEKAADLLLAAQAPVILAGTGVDWADARIEIRELAELLALPVAVSYTAKGVFPDSHPLALGCLGVGGRPYSRKFFLESDLILALGTTFSEGTTLGFEHRTIPARAKIIQIDIDPDELGRNYPVHLGIHADLKAALKEIIAEIKRRKAGASSNDPKANEIKAAKAEWMKQSDQETDRQGMSRDAALKALNRSLGGKEILVGSGITGGLLTYMDTDVPVIHSGEFRAIGTAFTTSLGVKLGLPDAKVVCVTGDGSFMMEQQELATARLHRIPVLVAVLNNSAYGSMKRHQIERHQGRVIGTDLFVPDLAHLAGLYDAEGITITRLDQIKPAVEKWLKSEELVILDVKLNTVK